MDPVIAALRAEGIAALENAPMSERTTLRVGGPAKALVEAASAREIALAREIAAAHGQPVLIVGNGSNLLVRDAGFDGVVIHIGEKMNGVRREGDVLHAGAGAMLASVAMAAQRAGLSGMEPLSGIPGTCGGAVYMNAGAYGGEIAGVLREATLLAPDGQVKTVPAAELGLGYRHSRMMETGEIVVEAAFALAPGDANAIAAAMRDYAARRREKQPVTLPSAGSFFKRPAGYFAGALIEGAGLKGLRVGGAEVSTLHAGFLVNVGGATAQDFLDLSAQVIERVRQTSGVTLEPEVQIV